MTEAEARAYCDRLAAEHPDRHTHTWVATRRGEEWVVAKIGVPPPAKTTPETRADERPPTPEDPQSESPLLGPMRNWHLG
jgi:hypothetical protein